MALIGAGQGLAFAGKSLAQIKKLFFDRKAVTAAVDRGRVRALSRFGGYLRRAAQTSMRYRKGASRPGQPPSAHKSKRLAALKRMKRARHNGALLREMLYYAYDPSSGSVVVGPLGFKAKGGVSVPALHEFGGTRAADGQTILVKNTPGRDVTGRFVSAGERVLKLTGTLRYPKRPYMGPALEKTRAKFAGFFRDSMGR